MTTRNYYGPVQWFRGQHVCTRKCKGGQSSWQVLLCPRTEILAIVCISSEVCGWPVKLGRLAVFLYRGYRDSGRRWVSGLVKMCGMREEPIRNLSTAPRWREAFNRNSGTSSRWYEALNRTLGQVPRLFVGSRDKNDVGNAVVRIKLRRWGLLSLQVSVWCALDRLDLMRWFTCGTNVVCKTDPVVLNFC